MKCQKCGKNEVCFHYSSNINGCTNETYLCSECMSNSGYDLGQIFDVGSIFDGIFPTHARSAAGGRGAYIPVIMPMISFGGALPYTTPHRMDSQSASCGCGGACDTEGGNEAEIDTEMQKRREIGVVREQMRLAAEREDYAKAAQLRDKLRELEA